jgi:hypothetical protein
VAGEFADGESTRGQFAHRESAHGQLPLRVTTPNAHLIEKLLRIAIIACDWFGGGQG